MPIAAAPDPVPTSALTPTPATATLHRAWSAHLTRPQEAFALAELALEQALRLGDDSAAAWAQLCKALAGWRWIGSDIAATRADFRAAGERMAAIGDERGARLAELEAAVLHMKQGQWPEALAAFEALIGHFDFNQLDPDNFYPLLGLSTSYVYGGNLAEGLRFGYSGLFMAQQLSLPAQQATMALPLGVALMAARDPDESANLFERAELIATQIDSPMLLKTIRTNLAVVLRRLGMLEAAEQRVTWVLSEPEPMIGGQQFAHFCGAELYIAQGRLEDAEAQLQAARQVLADKTPLPLDSAKLHFIGGLIASRRGQTHAAVAELQLATQVFPHLQALRFSDRAQVYEELGAALAAEGRFEAAYQAQRQSAQEYLANVQVLNRVRQFSLQMRFEISRVQAQLEREAHERRSLQSTQVRLHEQMERAIKEAERLKDQATRDPLTGLHNRRYMDEALPSLLRLSQQSATPVAIAFIDMDRFKSINDQHGHAMGDAVLTGFGVMAADLMRGSDVIGRYGGEEFVMALIGCGPAAARKRLEELLDQLKSRQFELQGASLHNVSFTAGVAIYPEDGIELTTLLATADRRLYKAKLAGRGQIASDDVPAPAGE